MNNKVYTYWHSTSWKEEWVIDHWRRSWERMGWIPVVIGLEDAKKEDLFVSYLQKVRSYHNIHNEEYRDCCYIRWLAMYHCAEESGSLWSDTDVINIGLRPEDVYYEPMNGWFCCLAAIRSGFRNVVDWIYGWDGSPLEIYDGKPYLSDMHIIIHYLQKGMFVLNPVMMNVVGTPGDLKLVHVSHHDCYVRKLDRRKVIEGLSKNPELYQAFVTSGCDVNVFSV